MSAVLKSEHKSKSPSDYVVADLGLADWGRKEIRIAETEMPGLMAIRDEFASAQPLQGRAHHRLAAHDDPDRGADRDAAGARRRGALGLVQHLLDAGPRRRRDRRQRHAGVRRTRARRSPSTGTTRTASSSGPTAATRNMILDDGGDATLLLHLGSKAEKDASVISQPGSEEETLPVRLDQGQARTRSDLVLDAAGEDQGRHRGDHDRRPAPVPDGARKASSRSPPSTSTTRSPSPSSTTCTAAASRWSTASSARPT